jgi:hypothetical protein
MLLNLHRTSTSNGQFGSFSDPAKVCKNPEIFTWGGRQVDGRSGYRVRAAMGVLYRWCRHPYIPVPVVWCRCFCACAADAPAYRSRAGGRLNFEKFTGKCQ